ncbi:bifunctional [glutamine synthetase] adenylyltransferase/[glutamine synthetase]-adenylyl-L-tyrosine phosphorylase [Actinomycetota bacterium]
MEPGRSATTAGALARLGFAEPGQAERLLADPALARLTQADDGARRLAEALSDVADPDLALLGLVRVLESATERDEAGARAMADAIAEDVTVADRVLGVLGASAALSDHLVAHPDHWRSAVEASASTVEERTERMLAAVRDPGEQTTVDALRVAYRRELLGIAARDVTAEDPVDYLPRTARALANLAEAALEAALEIARQEVGEDADLARLAVIGMGKTGGQELNYISDVDVIFVAEPAPGVEEDRALAVATALATHLMRACSASTAAGSLWQVDPNLRPEGKNGPLVRTVESHRSYYGRWAKTWEFQALLKARPVAGDRELGQAYLDVVAPLVWEAASRENFVEDVQSMRRRVEEHVPPAEAKRQLKLGKGGLRDVEFSVQLLQLVHGRSDETLRSRTTLQALADLAAGGYVAREDAEALDTAYRLLRTLEHRIQLYRLRRTHLMPTSKGELRRLGRALGYRSEPGEEVVRRWQGQAREVRRLHERLFYRPLLSSVAKLSSDEARLTPEAARDRLSALGFRDPAGALRHLESLTSGVSRRAAIQRTLLPVMLGWFASEADPDAGLLAFRQISDDLGTTHWYLKLLRDEGTAAERLAHTLARSRFAADLLVGAPDAVQLLADERGLQPRERDELVRRMMQAAHRRDDAHPGVLAARAIRRTELFSIAVADLYGLLDLAEVGSALTALTEALVETALDRAVHTVVERVGEDLSTRIAVIGMGRLGGGEIGYSSDADVVFVHDPHEDADEQVAQDQALEVVKELRSLLNAAGPDPKIGLDADLRPEGKSGPLVRSLASYRAYYERWSLTWESQALLRARPIAGDPELGAAFIDLIDPLRWPVDGLSADDLRQVRRLKARMESERLPRGGDPKTHFKLGRGGLSDVEWTVQLLQMQHAHAVPALRTTATLPALAAAVDAGLMGESDASALRESWVLASRMRNAAVLFRGRPVDSVPTQTRDADGIGRILGLGPAATEELAETYRRSARRARRVVERLFYGEE